MTTKRLLSIFLFILSLFYLTSCDELFDERIEGNDIVITRDRTISSFDEVVCKGDFDVYVTIADSTSLTIEAEENLFPFIITEVRGEKFYVEVKDDYWLDNNEPMRIFVTTSDMEGAILAGSGKIICDNVTEDFLSLEITGSGRIEYSNIDVQDIDAEISGSGDILISGIADRGDFAITGSGSIRSLDLQQQDCEARITGSGNMYVNVDDYLKAVITGSGDIYYTGSPIVETHITGTGDVRRY